MNDCRECNRRKVVFVIRPAARGFILVNENGDDVRSGMSAAQLADWAFDNGADEVTHRYLEAGCPAAADE